MGEVIIVCTDRGAGTSVAPLLAQRGFPVYWLAPDLECGEVWTPEGLAPVPAHSTHAWLARIAERSPLIVLLETAPALHAGLTRAGISGQVAMLAVGPG